MLDKLPIDPVLMDIMLPGLDGYEITRRIQADERFRRLPVLAPTAKPIDTKRLFSMLRVWLSRD